MPFEKFDVRKAIETAKAKDPEFAKEWEESRTGYRLLSEMVALRKKQNLTQGEIAKRTGNKQQVISRIEKRENSPSLKTFCSLIHSLGYDLIIVKQKKASS